LFARAFELEQQRLQSGYTLERSERPREDIPKEVKFLRDLEGTKTSKISLQRAKIKEGAKNRYDR